ncbi:MAG: MFS transporter, partial [Pseudomonadota bacterium]
MGSTASHSGETASVKARAGWAIFDWAHQPFFTLSAFIFAPYFASTLVGNTVQGQALWGYMLGITGLIIATTSPFLGAIADCIGVRKPWIFAFSVVVAVCAALLWWAAPETNDAVLFALVMFGIATVAAEYAVVFNNAMLPSLVSEKDMGRLSGIAWGLGYAGGMVVLIFMLFALVLPAEPLFGLDAQSHEPERLYGPISAVWLAVFMVPFLLWTPDAPRTDASLRAAAREGVIRVWDTIAHARKLKNLGRFLISRMLYQDGRTAILSFAGLYGAGVFGWHITTLGLFAIILNVIAVPGTVLGGFVDERIGPKPTIILAVAGLMVGTLGVLSIDPNHVLFVIDVPPRAEGAAPLTSVAELTFLGFSAIVGLCVGPAQSSSRTFMARLAPRDMTTEFF